MHEPNQTAVGGRTTRGAIWLIASRLVARLIDLVLLLILGRLLGPADFGIIAIAMTLITIIEATLELPLLQNLIRIRLLARSHLDTAFTLAALRGLTLALVIGGLAWPFSRFYADSRLLPVICALSLAPATRGLSSPAMAIYARSINFKRDFVLEISGKLVSFVIAVTMALLTRSYWSLVVSVVMTPLSTTLISYWIAPYRPRLSLAEWPSFASFLGWTSAAQLLFAINWQCDRFLVSRNTSRDLLGQFSMASDLAVSPIQALVVPLLRPLTAAFALLREDAERLGTAYLRASNTLLAVGTPLMLGLSALAGPAVDIALGTQWHAAAPILQWLAIASIPSMFVTPLTALAMALSRTGIFFRQALIDSVTKIPMVVAGILLFGIPGVIAARLASSLMQAATAMIFVRQLCGLSLSRQILSTWRTLASGAGMYLLVSLLEPLASTSGGVDRLLLIAALVAAGAAVYFAMLLSLWWCCGCPAGVESHVVAAPRAIALRLFARSPLARSEGAVPRIDRG